MKELEMDLQAVLDDLIHLRQLNDDTLDCDKLDRHIVTLEKTLQKITMVVV